jgi:hypothetical protein
LADYATRKTIAAEFDVSERTIDRWVSLRLLPAPLKLGHTSLFHLPTLRKHLAERCGPKGSRRRH